MTQSGQSVACTQIIFFSTGCIRKGINAEYESRYVLSKNSVKFKNIKSIIFSRVHATLYVTMSVGWSVGWLVRRSVRNHFSFLGV